MIVYNLFLSTKIGSKILFKNNDNQEFKERLNVFSTFAEVGATALMFPLFLGWVSSLSMGITPLPVVIFTAALYLIAILTFGSNKHTKYLERRASLGLDPDEVPLFDENGKEKGLIKIGKKEEDSEGVFNIDEEVMETWSKELEGNNEKQ